MCTTAGLNNKTWVFTLMYKQMRHGEIPALVLLKLFFNGKCNTNDTNTYSGTYSRPNYRTKIIMTHRTSKILLNLESDF